MGARDLCLSVEKDVNKFIRSFVVKTQVEETHRLVMDWRGRAGLTAQLRYPLTLDKCWLDEDEDIDVTLVHQSYCSLSETSVSENAIVLDAPSSRIAIIIGSSCTLCGCLLCDRAKARVTYWAGPPDGLSDDDTVKRLMCVLAWHRRADFVTEPDDQPFGAPFTSKRVTDISRSWSPPQYRSQFFGYSQLAIDLEDALHPYVRYRSRRFQ